MVKKASNNLLGKLGSALAQAHEAHKADETVIGGGGSLPTGIENGIAQLVDCYFKQYKEGDMAGEYFFYAAGVVKTPSHQDGIPIKGLRTSIMEPLCDTPTRSRKTVDEHYAWILNEIRKLGVDTSEIDYSDIEETVAALKEAAPHFRFRTWQGKATEEFPDPRVQEQWRGVCEFEDDELDGVEDDTQEDKPEPKAKTTSKVAPKASNPSSNATKPVSSPKVAPKPAEASKSVPKTETKKKLKQLELNFAEMDFPTLATHADEGNEDASAIIAEKAQELGIDPTEERFENWSLVVEAIQSHGDSDDIAGLGDKADEGDAEAAEKLQELADAAGIDTTAYGTWAEVEHLLGNESAAAADDGTEYEDAEEFVPDVKEVYFYKPPKAKKAVECEVTMVNTAKQLVSLKDLDKGTFYKGVSWSELANEA